MVCFVQETGDPLISLYNCPSCSGSASAQSSPLMRASGVSEYHFEHPLYFYIEIWEVQNLPKIQKIECDRCPSVLKRHHLREMSIKHCHTLRIQGKITSRRARHCGHNIHKLLMQQQKKKVLIISPVDSSDFPNVKSNMQQDQQALASQKRSTPHGTRLHSVALISKLSKQLIKTDQDPSKLLKHVGCRGNLQAL